MPGSSPFLAVDLASAGGEDVCIALATAQGVLNRQRPHMFLLWNARWDRHWADWYADYGLEAEELGAWQALERVRTQFSGAVVWDPAFRAVLPLAVTLAGVHGVPALSPALAERLGLPALEDLRARFADKRSLYEWAEREVWPRCRRTAVGSLSEGEAGQFNPMLCDYLACHQSPVHNLSVNPATDWEPDFCHRLLHGMQPQALALGWHLPTDIEATYVDACSRHGLVQICSAAGSNLSFHQHLKAQAPLRQRHIRPQDVRLEKKVYVALCQTDGDALHSMCNLQQGHWASAYRGSLPFGWQIAPRLAADLGPALLQYYYRTLTPNDCLVLGPSGIGYNYPSVQKDLDAYLTLTAAALEQTDTDSIWAINRTVRYGEPGYVIHRTSSGEIPFPIEGAGPNEEIKNRYGADWVDERSAGRYFERCPQLIGCFQGFETIPKEEDRLIAGKPWVPTKVMIDSPEQGLRDIQAYLRGRPLPAFVAATVNMCGPMNQRMFEKLLLLLPRLRALGYEILRPDAFLLLRAKALAAT